MLFFVNFPAGIDEYPPENWRKMAQKSFVEGGAHLVTTLPTTGKAFRKPLLSTAVGSSSTASFGVISF